MGADSIDKTKPADSPPPADTPRASPDSGPARDEGTPDTDTGAADSGVSGEGPGAQLADAGAAAVRAEGSPDTGAAAADSGDGRPGTTAPDAGEQGESSRWLMQLHVEGPTGEWSGNRDPDGIRTDKYWMPVDDLVTDDPSVANGTWAQLCERLDVPRDDPLSSLYEPDQLVKEWDLVAAQHGLPPEWGARTQVTFARVPDDVEFDATPVAPVRYAPWSAAGALDSFPEPLPHGTDPGEVPGAGEAAFSYQGIPTAMGSEVHFGGQTDVPAAAGASEGSGDTPFDDGWIHGPPHEVPELADDVIAAADAAAGGDPLGRVIEITRAMSDQTFKLDTGQDPPVVVTDEAGSPQDADRRYRLGGELPVEVSPGSPPEWKAHDEMGAATAGDAAAGPDQDAVVRLPADWDTPTDLPPNATIDAGDFQFGTDDQGRIIQADGTLQQGKAPRERWDATRVRQLIPEGFDDQAGHLFAAALGGPGDHWNMVPQDRNLNQSEWKRMENAWKGALDRGPVQVNITPSYHGDDLRPYAFHVEYTVVNEQGTTETEQRDILNAPRAAADEPKSG